MIRDKVNREEVVSPLETLDRADSPQKPLVRRLRVACGALGGIYAGKVKANGVEWCEGKEDVTSDVLRAIIEYVEPGYEMDVNVNGEPKYRIAVTEISKAKDA
jgi:hypothetical protein